VIDEIFPKDAGVYLAKAKNSAGEATTTCNVIYKVVNPLFLII
jgi:hypothetical protein